LQLLQIRGVAYSTNN